MHSLETFNQKLWIIGGRSNLESTFETLFNDVWYSDDGVSWSEATSSAGWSKRFGHSSAVWKDKLWVMGGSRFFHNNEVWCSSNGKDWIRSKEDAGWSPRFGQASVVFRDTLWVLGGKYGGGKFTNDVWYLTSKP